MDIILASQSPRRKALLAQIGLPFRVVISNIDEEQSYHLPPSEMVAYLSQEKAKKIAVAHPQAVVIGADTTVVCKGKVIGKPTSVGDAQKILHLLSGTSHTVITGVTVIHGAKLFTETVTTKVFFRRLSLEEIADYVATGEPMDKAGGYGIQEKGGIFIEKIVGDYANVVGLPLVKLYELLKKVDIQVIDFWPKK